MTDTEKQLFNYTLQSDKKINKLFNQLMKEFANLGIDTSSIKKDEVFTFAKKAPLKIREKVKKMTQDFHDAVLKELKSGISSAYTLSLAENVQQAAKIEKSKNKYELSSAARSRASQSYIENRVNSKYGLSLSQRVWNYTDQAKAEFEASLSLAVNEALEDGSSAEELQRKLRTYLNDPDMMYRRYRHREVLADGTKKWKMVWHKRVISKDGKVHFVEQPLEKVGQGVYRSARKNALRTARTEINIAYRSADCEQWSKKPYVLGFRISLSNNHTTKIGQGDKKVPLHDMCDELQGDYPKTFNFSGWHPNCRCVLTPITATADQMAEYFNSGMPDGFFDKYTIKDMPANFTNWINDNSERIANATSLPYFIRDNFVNGDINAGYVWQNQSLTNEQPQADININQEGNTAQNEEKEIDKYEAVREAAKERHAKRTESEQESIQKRWKERLLRNEAQKQLSQKLGIPIDKPMSHEEADQQKANPHFHFDDAYTENCQTCVVAYEMRRRGLDVSALPCVPGSYSEELSYNTRLAWKDINGDTPQYIYRSGKVTLKKLSSEIGKAMHEKGRYTIGLQWKGEKYGHIFIVEKLEDGDTLLRGQYRSFDPQTGNGDVLVKYLKEARLSSIRILRVDNLIIDDDFSEKILTKQNAPAVTSLNEIIIGKKAGILGAKGINIEPISQSQVITSPKRLEQADRSKNEQEKYIKEYNMCQVIANNGHIVEHFSNEEYPFDVKVDGIAYDLKQTSSANNIVNYAKKAVREQGATGVIFEFTFENEKIYSELNKLTSKYNIHGYYYFTGRNTLYEF